mmetsp:Transcript_23332/g.33315  ORF Transcript_23332/g.33315 Transcript_23332/m.33315 type:complete len:92 (-) Transcript_23332:68-343(-)
MGYAIRDGEMFFFSNSNRGEIEWARKRGGVDKISAVVKDTQHKNQSSIFPSFGPSLRPPRRSLLFVHPANVLIVVCGVFRHQLSLERWFEA